MIEVFWDGDFLFLPLLCRVMQSDFWKVEFHLDVSNKEGGFQLEHMLVWSAHFEMYFL
jgi:hypothetical protein